MPSTFVITDLQECPAQAPLRAHTWPLPAALKGLLGPAPWLPVGLPGQRSLAPAPPSLCTPGTVCALGERTPGAASPDPCGLAAAGGKPGNGGGTIFQGQQQQQQQHSLGLSLLPAAAFGEGSC